MKVPKAKKLPSGSWCCRVMIGGQSICITRDTARAAEQEAMRLKAIGKAERMSGRTLEAAYRSYIDARADVLSPSTVAGYNRLARNTFAPLMPMKVSAINSRAVQAEVSRMHRDGKSPKYIANAYGLLTAVLHMEAPEITLNVRLPQRQAPEQRQLSPEEMARLIEGARGDPVELPVLMGLWLGMRMSEVRGVRYGDISGNILHIQTAIVDNEAGQAIEKQPKTLAGNRYVPLPDYILGLIGDPHGREDEHIVQLSGQAIYKRFVRLCERLGIPPCRFHDLRHANAAVMVRLGIDSKYAQQRNGWSSDQMYKQTYAYTMQDQQNAVAVTINDYFKRLVEKD